MTDKRDKFIGRPVSKDTVKRELGVPSAEWERLSRRLKFRNLLTPGQEDLDLSGICGYGAIKGYLDHLAESLVRPQGVGTGLVSAEEDAAIRAELEPEIRAEIAKYEARRRQLEQQPEAVEAHLRRMQRWFILCNNEPPYVRDDDLPEEFQEMERQAAIERVADLKSLEEDIDQYARRLAELRGEHKV